MAVISRRKTAKVMARELVVGPGLQQVASQGRKRRTTLNTSRPDHPDTSRRMRQVAILQLGDLTA